MTDKPTDEEIIMLAVELGVSVRTGKGAVKLARAVLAKWGTPQAGAAESVPAVDERAAFEAQFPVPGGVHWDGTEYVVKDSYVNSYRCDRFVGQWEAWKARAARARLGGKP